NLLLADKGLLSAGDYFTVALNGEYADGLLTTGEFVNVPFTICLKKMSPFRFFVDVLGVAE
ncbi:MAG: hypothetical protein JSW10_08605, partial [Pseudomonadota bacterium]